MRDKAKRVELEHVGTAEERLAGALKGLIMAGKEHLNLTAEQERFLVNDFVAYMHVRGALEKRIIQLGQQSSVAMTLVIPAYPVEGKALRDSFYDRLNSDLTPEVTDRVDEWLGSQFDAYFRGFGQMQQTFNIQSSTSDPTSVRVEWSTAFPDKSVELSGAMPFGSYLGRGSVDVDQSAMTSGEYESISGPVSKFLQERRAKE